MHADQPIISDTRSLAPGFYRLDWPGEPVTATPRRWRWRTAIAIAISLCAGTCSHFCPVFTRSAAIWLSHAHPLIVQFPLVLIMTSALAETIGVFRQRHAANPAIHPTARFCLSWSVPAILMAALTGWLKFATGQYPGTVSSDLNHHRWMGTLTCAWSVVLLVLCLHAHHSNRSRSRWIFRTGLLIGVVLVSVTCHLGGGLVFGNDLLSFSDLQP